MLWNEATSKKYLLSTLSQTVDIFLPQTFICWQLDFFRRSATTPKLYSTNSLTTVYFWRWLWIAAKASHLVTVSVGKRLHLPLEKCINCLWQNKYLRYEIVPNICLLNLIRQHITKLKQKKYLKKLGNKLSLLHLHHSFCSNTLTILTMYLKITYILQTLTFAQWLSFGMWK